MATRLGTDPPTAEALYEQAPAWEVGLRLRRGKLFEYSLSGPDPLRAFPGPVTPPGPVDGSGLGFVVNTLPRLSAGRAVIRNRTLLAIAEIGRYEQARVVGVRQYLSIGGNTDAFPAFVEQQVSGAAWTFTDTWTTWHVSWAAGRKAVDIENAGSAGLDGYAGFAGWGTIHELRFPWVQQPAPKLDAPVRGPGCVLMWLEWAQTNPETRPRRSPGPPGAFINPDDQFAEMAYPLTSVYYRIAGALTVERGLATDPGGQ